MVSTGTQSSTSTEFDGINHVFNDMEWCSCFPRREAVQGVSWDKYHGRRYMGCPLFKKGERNGCKYFRWIDVPVAPHVANMITGLLRQKLAAEHRVGVMELEVADMGADVNNLLEMNSKKIADIAEKDCVLEEFIELAKDNKVIVADKKQLAMEMKGMLSKNKMLKKRLEKMELGFIVLLGVLAICLGWLVFSKWCSVYYLV